MAQRSTNDRLVVNTRQLAVGRHGGVARYTEQLLRSLQEADVAFDVVAPPQRFASGVLGHLWEQIVLPVLMITPKRRGRVLVSPANFGPVLVRRQRVTIHDVAPLDHPEWFTKRTQRLFSAIVPLLARRAREVRTVSAFSRGRIAERCGVDEDSIVVEPVSPAPIFVPPTQPVARRDVVVVGGPDPRKNVGAALDAWALVRDELIGHDVVVVTGTRSSGMFAGAVEPSGRGVSVLVDPTDDELVRQFQTAAVVVFVPLYEGYGLPPVEAAACGAPVVVSDAVPSRHDLDDVGVLVVPPGDAGAIAEAIKAAVQAG